ncbi:FlaG/FlaF family flagellin (archaellin) [Methanomicrobium sp. W14]|uniref:type IV pilin n=1 Tax=Methanomicrobium sp. W14 TaxID=2817839 RepID=UPI001AEA6545|nr:FlaG/FlaF family flagellin (archaellin) [Methanomicrobium sp. W14]
MKHNSSAVSEVVGVLLMLTVTLLITGLVVVAVNGLNKNMDKPVTASVTASEISEDANNKYIIFDNTLGDSFTLDRIMISLGIYERPADNIIIYGSDTKRLKSYSGDGIVALGGRFRLLSDYEDRLGWDSFEISSGEHLDYALYDRRANALISKGSIVIP